MIRIAAMTEKAHAEPSVGSGEGQPSLREEALVASRSIRRRRGRPKGTDYGRVDAPRHEEMRKLLETGAVPSISAAAWQVVDKAYGPGSERASKVRRLVRSYPYSQYAI